MISTTFEEHQVYWTLPLPYDLIYLLVATYLENSPATLCALSLASKALAEICRPLKFRNFVLRIPQHKPGSGYLAEFLALLTALPNIIDFIGHLIIADGHGGSMPRAEPKPQGSDLTWEGAISSLLPIFTAHDLGNLKRLTISLYFDWSSFPTELYRTFAYIFARPTICAVEIERRVVFPTTFLRLLNNTSSLAILGDLYEAPTDLPGIQDLFISSTPSPSSHCVPEKLVLKDDSRSGTNLLTLLPSTTTPFHLARLSELRVYLKGPHIAILNDIIGSCSKSLTALNVHVATWGGLPAPLNLQDLTVLKSLRLTVDVEMMPYGQMTGTEAPARFNWFLSALETCKAPNPNLHTIGLILRARSSQEVQKLSWTRIDDLFAARLSTSWIHLKTFDVLLVEENAEANESISTEDPLKQVMDQLLPCIAKLNALRVRRSNERMEFWRM